MKSSIDYNTKVLEVSNLKQYFKVGVGKNKLKVKAVDDVSFDIYKKEVFGLVGESGCGKTTTGRTIIRLYRPTNGVVKLNGNVVGVGVNDFFKALKYEKIEYKESLLELNDYKYAVHNIKKDYNNKIKDIKHNINKIKKDYHMLKTNLEKPILDYEGALFDEKNAYEVKQEKLLFDFRIDKEDIINRTKNEFLLEYNSLISGLKEATKKKLTGLKESAGLDDEQKEAHRKKVLEHHDKKLQEYDDEFRDKIAERSSSLLSKEDCKKEIQALNLKFLDNKNKLIQEHQEFINTLEKPDYEKIKNEVLLEKEKMNKRISDDKEEIQKLRKDMNEEISKVNLSSFVDKDKLNELKKKHQEFVDNQRANIREARSLHFSKEAEKNVKQMQMIFQDPISSLNPRMTVQEIVSEGLIINGVKDKEYIKEKVIEALQLVGLTPEYMSRYPHEFSGGQRQRIGIARAIIMNPSVIVADEPISALDVSIKAQVINLLSELKEKLDLTILFIAHDLSVVKFFCDRIAVMYFGKIVEMASSEELFKNPLHGYTKALLSAIPHPDPDFEKKRVRTSYSPAIHDYSVDGPKFVEITSGHFVYANEKEIKEMKKELGGKK